MLFLGTCKWPKRGALDGQVRGLAGLISRDLSKVLLCVRHQLGRDRGRSTISDALILRPRSRGVMGAMQTAGGAGHVHRGLAPAAFPHTMFTHHQSWPPALSSCVSSPKHCLILGEISVFCVSCYFSHMSMSQILFLLTRISIFNIRLLFTVRFRILM